jgi:hypothetical protein
MGIELTLDERETEILDRIQGARLAAALAYERYAGAKMVFDHAGKDERWHHTPQTVVVAQVDAIDHLGDAYAAAQEAEIKAVDELTKLYASQP